MKSLIVYIAIIFLPISSSTSTLTGDKEDVQIQTYNENTAVVTGHFTFT